MKIPETESRDQVITNEPAAVSPWTAPQLNKLTIEDTASSSPNDIADAGFLS